MDAAEGIAKMVEINSDLHAQSLVSVYKFVTQGDFWFHGAFWRFLVLQGIPMISWVFQACFECFLISNS